MRTVRGGLCLLVVAIVTVAGGFCGGDAMAVPLADRAALRRAMDDLVAAGAVGVQLRVHDESEDWTGSSGVAEIGRPEPPSTDGRFRIGSITKMFVSTVVLQLVGEGRLGLDDPVRDHLPEYGIDPRITVRMLLQHTSGLFDYTGETNPDGTEEAGIPLRGAEFVDNKLRGYTLAELARFALARPARFAPGAQWRYSNTNYILAGLLIERLTGTPYAWQIYGRIIVPLGLWSTWLPGEDPHIPDPHAHGYYPYRRDGKDELADITELNPSWGGSAGEIISTTADLDQFITALLGGRLLAPNLLDMMRTPVPVPKKSAGYGLGLAVLRMRPNCEVVGHDGGIHGYLSELLSTADGGRRLAMSVTIREDPDSGSTAFTEALTSIVAALCE
ncbi:MULTISPECIES: serine hydrolase [unclassified Nocardia]|uniref:serine hydrolase domain-containing protein n=1 Tax=unclassified Nocardia TaxID=2637762 RepID=UPI001CE46F8D|nr:MULTISPECIES: serine hydrolase domain-containing protein [unclassified Nocardia]